MTALFTVLILFVILIDAAAETVQIEFTKFNTYSIKAIHIDVGDSEEWLPKNAVHNVDFIAGQLEYCLRMKRKVLLRSFFNCQTNMRHQ